MDLEPSPLALVSPDALTALFESDPLTLTDPQLTSLVLELRRRRNAFTADEAAKAAKGKSARVKAEAQSAASAATSDKPITETSLDDLLDD